MFSTAIRRKPSATSCGPRPSPISSASAANLGDDAGVERLVGVRAEDGRKMGRDSLPSMTLQSVTVSGPPLR
jgi:hypothetical protein